MITYVISHVSSEIFPQLKTKPQFGSYSCCCCSYSSPQLYRAHEHKCYLIESLHVGSMLKRSLVVKPGLETISPDSISRTFPSSTLLSSWSQPVLCIATMVLIPLFSTCCLSHPTPPSLQALKIKSHLLMLFTYFFK